jgi:hypothetical protein
MNYFPQSPMYLLSLPVHPGFFGLLAAATGNATWRTQNLTHGLPVDLRIQSLTADSCKLLDMEASLHRNPARHPVGNGLGLRVLASCLGKHASEIRDAMNLLDCLAKGLRAGMWIRCLHAHRLYTPCEFSQLLCEFSL